MSKSTPMWFHMRFSITACRTRASNRREGDDSSIHLASTSPTLQLRRVLDNLTLHDNKRLIPRQCPLATQVRMLDRLAWSEMFENFLSTKYTAAKRFGLEGGETLIPGMKALIDRAADLGVESVTIGMPHRGRLNVLGNVVRKPLAQIFSEFQGGVKPSKEGGYTGSGDVKYHLGTSHVYMYMHIPHFHFHSQLSPPSLPLSHQHTEYVGAFGWASVAEGPLHAGL